MIEKESVFADIFRSVRNLFRIDSLACVNQFIASIHPLHNELLE